jgi:hypothetical protein
VERRHWIEAALRNLMLDIAIGLDLLILVCTVAGD